MKLLQPLKTMKTEIHTEVPKVKLLKFKSKISFLKHTDKKLLPLKQ